MPNQNILILGGTGKTGHRVVSLLRAAGAPVQAAARRGADVAFDWANVTAHRSALQDVGALYLVTQSLRPRHAEEVSAFLDLVEGAGVQHVTLLSARGVDQAPAEVPARAIELDLSGRRAFTHSILRPNWFMQNFSESFFQPSIAANGLIPAPTGTGAEAFVDANDVAAVAVATLLDPSTHDGLAYTLSGPVALSFSQAAERIAAATGRAIRHVNQPVEQWVAESLSRGMDKSYADLHVMLFAAINSGRGSSTTDDVQRVTGRQPSSFEDYATGREALATWLPGPQ